MRILHIIASADPKTGGVIEGVLQTSRIMSRFGAESEIVCFDTPGSDWLNNADVTIHALGRLTSFYEYAPAAIPWFRKHLSSYDVVIVNGLWNYSALAASVALRARHVPYFVFPHGMMDPWFRKRYPLKHRVKQLSWFFSEGPLLANANAVLFTTDEERRLARGEFLCQKYRELVVGYGTTRPSHIESLDGNNFRKRLPALGSRRFLLFLGRIHPKKGCDLLLSAFASISDEYREVDLVIAGPDQVGLQRELMQMAEARGIADRIHWPGVLLGDAKWEAYRAADAFILPSHQENFGIVVAEALACDTPVLITNKVNIWREVQDSAAGLVDDDNEAGITRLLVRYLNLPSQEVHAMRSSARRCFDTHFDAVSVSRTLVDIVSEAVATCRKS
ncbi:glycosyltransferase [Bradyrhizobium sp. BRP23]|uniref:glycosyltransferase n=1 Tax=Bradyrhizobium sp. BRP23 TaxID=2793820 RepID=UPI001CD1FE9E|nr:glycosyltransferase [Bradyrhizobium sp. BRP23]MCA1379280.1 glycosyltransferase [Bradyrhizobium sp. BRP05]MCA1420544.1 glycosyltransferase [Bradyrhizobium sp. BRP23]